MAETRDTWGTKIGLILAMAGNAVGLGNFWRFPYQAAANGGGSFMIPYFFALFFLGIPLMLVEWTQGRTGGRYGHGTVAPMLYLHAREAMSPAAAAITGAVGGMFAFSVMALLTSYYSQIIGWTLGYSYLSLTGAYMDKAVNTGAFFVSYIQNPWYVFIFWGIALLLMAYTVSGGVQGGIEKWASVMMPILYLFGILLAIRAITLGAPVKPEWSAIKGLDYLWEPRWSDLTWKSALAAAGQIFFTLSVGMGIIQNYASYLKPDDDIVLSGLATVSLNEFAEVILGGSIAIPIAYAYLGQEGVKSGVGLSFIALPNVFRDLPGGQIWGSLWFFLLFIAGFTSAIAMFNYLSAMLEEDAGINRKVGAYIAALTFFIIGLPVALEPILTKTAYLAYLTELDNWVGSYFLVVLGLIEVLVTATIWGKGAWEEMNRGAYVKVPRWYFEIFMRWVTPLYIAVILTFSTIDYAKGGYFSFNPATLAKFVGVAEKDIPKIGPWVLAARIVIITVLIIGFFVSYSSIKRTYGEEIAQGKVLIRR